MPMDSAWAVLKEHGLPHCERCGGPMKLDELDQLYCPRCDLGIGEGGAPASPPTTGKPDGGGASIMNE